MACALKGAEAKLTPSQYLQLCQLKMSPDEILRYVRILWAKYKSEEECTTAEKYLFIPKCNTIGLNFIFYPSPPIVVFRVRQCHTIEQRTIHFRNDDLIPQSITVTLSEIEHFKIIYPTNYHQKVAPGMGFAFQLQFEPAKCQDYYCEMKCVADKKTLIIPIFCVGPRAFLDLPNSIAFPPCPIKHVSNKILIVRNIGEKECRFSLTPQDKKYFTISPEHCVIPINQFLQVDVEFRPEEEGEKFDDVLIHYETGERLFITVSGIGENVNIRLDKNTLHLQSTFIGMRNVRQVTLLNSSEICSHFRWSSHADDDEEKSVHIQSEDTVGTHTCLFEKNVLEIEPKEGDIWRKSSLAFNVIFKPEEDRQYVFTAYCDVEGRQKRIPLKIVGEGKGPSLTFFNNKLDIGKILVGTLQSYEVIIKNDGFIPATFTLRPSVSLFGRYFKFIPESDSISPDKMLVLNVSVDCPLLGDFYEEFNFDVERKKYPVTLIISGCCVGPTVTFEKQKINLGHVAFGYPATKLITLENKSLIPVHFHLRVIEDFSEVRSLNETESREFENALLFDTILGKSKEFSASPVNSVINPNSTVSIEIKLTAHSVKHYKYHLLVDLQGVGKAVTSVSIIAKSLIPKISLVDQNIAFDRCFLEFPYKEHIRLKNDSLVPAIYHIIPQVIPSDSVLAIKYEALEPMGVIEPQNVASIPLLITPKTVGVLRETLMITVTGNLNSAITVPISCTACGPVVDVQPESMDWGLIPVLQKTSRIIQVNNLSPIPAAYVANMVNLNSVWKLEPTSGIVPPNSTSEITLYAFFQDTQKFQDKVNIKITHSITYTIPVWVKTYGTTIGIEPPIGTLLQLKPHFSNVLLQKKFVIINHGRKSQQLFWSVESANKDRSHGESPNSPVFHLVPSIMELSPGQSMDFMLESLCTKPQKVMEIISCHGIKGRTKTKEMVMQFELQVEFINPSLQYSANEIKFKVYKEKNKELQNRVSALTLTNISVLPLTFNLKVNYPFQVLLEGNISVSTDTITIPVGECTTILIIFDPNYIDNKIMRSVEDELHVIFSDHPQVDTIKLTGEVYFANLSFDKAEIIFDHVFNGLEWRNCLVTRNTSPFDVEYEWSVHITNHGRQRVKENPSNLTCKVEDNPDEWKKLLSIIPIKGILHPGDSQTVAFFFCAESTIGMEGVALCQVDDGPSYPIAVKAQASELDFEMQPRDIYVGSQIFNEFVSVKVNLTNFGNVGFDYCTKTTLNDKAAIPFDENTNRDNIYVGHFSAILPFKGYVNPHESQILTIKILPVFPGEFQHNFFVEIAHFEPILIKVWGECVFPLISIGVGDVRTTEQSKLKAHSNQELENCVIRCLQNMDLDEVEPGKARLRYIKSNLSHCFDGYHFAEVVVDFGFVILGSIVSKTVCVMNTSNLPLSFKLEISKLARFGFFVDVDQVKSLPPNRGISFILNFNPLSLNIPLGETIVQTFIKIANGPPNVLLLRAVVTKPSLHLSTTDIDFGEVQCSFCKVFTIQLHNDGYVPCEWECIFKKQKSKRVLLHSKYHSITNPIFEIRPSKGFLQPREKINIEVLFIPHQSKCYNEQLIFKLRKSSATPLITVKGVGIDPHIEINPLFLEFEPALPFGEGCEKEVIIHNVCDFPVEIYSVTRDEQFREDDKLLRLLIEYDEYDSILIPARYPAHKLPKEFYSHYLAMAGYVRRFLNICSMYWHVPTIESSTSTVVSTEIDSEGTEKSAKETDAVDDCKFTESEVTFISQLNSDPTSNEAIYFFNLNSHTQVKLLRLVHKFYDELESLGLDESIKSPVRAALAAYLKPIKFPEGNTDESCHYLAAIIFGAPGTEQMIHQLASTIAREYNAKIVTLDKIIQEEIISSNCNAAITARELCLQRTQEAHKVLVAKHSKDYHGTLTGDAAVKEEMEKFKFKIGNQELYPTFLPNHIIAEILLEYVQQVNNENGLIFLGISSKFCVNITSAITNLLYAFSEKKHLYCVTLHKAYDRVKEINKAIKQEEMESCKRMVSEEIRMIQEMSEEDYDKLSPEEEIYVDKIIQQIKQEWFLQQETSSQLSHTQSSKERAATAVTNKKLSGKLKRDEEISSPDQLAEKFNLFQETFQELCLALETWDPTDTASHSHSEADSRRSRLSKMGRRATRKKEIASTTDLAGIQQELTHLGISHLVFDVSADKDVNVIGNNILSHMSSPDEIQHSLQLVRNNVYCPQPYFLSLVLHPMETRMPLLSEHFEFVASKIISAATLYVEELNTEITHDDVTAPELSSSKSVVTLPKILNSTPSVIFEPEVEEIKYRWQIPPFSKLALKIRFHSSIMGQFDNALQLEIMGCRRQYPIYCRGVCRLPDINRQPSVLFDEVKKSTLPNEIISKVYVQETKTYDFGPLLVLRPDAPPSVSEALKIHNSVKLNIVNVSAMVAEVNFHFLEHNVFYVEPAKLKLDGNAQTQLTLTAIAKTEGIFKDKLVCCIQNNPEPLIIQLSCIGVHPEFELEPQVVNFDRVLMHRKECHSVELINKSFLPLSWKLVQTNDNEEFSFPLTSGSVKALSVGNIKICFQSPKAVISKQTASIEIYHLDKNLGLISTEILTLNGESYDVMVDITFPKTQEYLDFGNIRVGEENKLTCTLKNRGKYDVIYNFGLTQYAKSNQETRKLLTINPSQGKLPPVDKAPANINITAICKRELIITDAPLLLCKLVEPEIKEGNEIVALIPISVTLRAHYAMFKIQPELGINFGPVLFEKLIFQTFSIENCGNFEFTFEIFQAAHSDLKIEKPNRASIDLSKNRKSTPKSDTILTLDNFTINPSVGAVSVGEKISIRVDCSTLRAGVFQSMLGINISDRETLNPINYPLKVEVCYPVFNWNSLPLIMEEHPICRNRTEAIPLLKTTNIVGVYCEKEELFIFKEVLINTSVEANFKISNNGKVPCEVQLVLKFSNNLESEHSEQITGFYLRPSSATINPYEHVFATVTFRPTQLQKYTCYLEIKVPSPEYKIRFTLLGEGILPSVRITKPKEQRTLTFRQLLVGETECLPFQVHNYGSISCILTMDVFDPNLVFTVHPAATTAPLILKKKLQDYTDIVEHAQPIIKGSFFQLQPDQMADFDVFFAPDKNQNYSGSVHLYLEENPYEKLILLLVGEGCDEEVMIKVQAADDSAHSEDVISPISKRFNNLNFGQCHVGQIYQQTIAVINKSTQAIRFEWAKNDFVSFLPNIGHVGGETSKDVVATLHSEEPVHLSDVSINCEICKIRLINTDVERVDSWDDRKKIVKWIKVPVESSKDDVSIGSEEFIEKRLLETESEPEFEVEEHSDKSLKSIVYAKIDYCSYKVDTTAIFFEDTFIFDTRICTFTVENTGSISLKCRWKISIKEGKTNPVTSLIVMRKERDYNPISITPLQTTIEPRNKQIFSVKFSPLEIGKYTGKLISNISNLSPDSSSDTEIKIKARSMLPYCHFQLEQSDYLSKNRRNSQSSLPKGISLNGNLKVIEITASGIGLKIQKSFSIINPTNADYKYHWQVIQCPTDDVTCLTMNGIVLSGKKAEITFQFKSRFIGIIESFWMFCIKSVNLSVPFLVVAHVKEPEIFASSHSFITRPLLKGQKTEVNFDLINHENTHIDFAFDTDSCFSQGRQAQLYVEPMSGTIPPKAKIHVKANFDGIVAGDYNFMLNCNVPQRSIPIRINVKVQVYEVKLLVYCQSGANKIELKPNEKCELDLGKVSTGEAVPTTIIIVNSGDVAFEYKWTVDPRSGKNEFLADVTPKIGFLKSSDSATCTVSVTPKVECKLEKIDFKLKIPEGPQYDLLISCDVEIPGVAFSSYETQFGKCFVNSAIYEKKVTVTNTQSKPISVACLFTPSPHLSVKFSDKILAPKHAAVALIQFNPIDVRTYEDIVPFVISGRAKKFVKVVAEGIEYKVVTANPQDKVVKLGAVKAGETKRKTIGVVNLSKGLINRPTFELNCDPILRECLVLFFNCSTIMAPLTGHCSVDIIFSPKQRIPNFTAEVIFVTPTVKIPICIVKGSCKALQVQLLDSVIVFGAVTEKCQLERKVIMHNTGDYGTRFHWDELKFYPDFSIHPTNGYISPGAQITFKINFHPTKISEDIKREGLKCTLEQGNSVSLTLIGACIQIQPARDVMRFTAIVRKKQIQEIVIENPSNDVWKLSPVVNGEYWSMPPLFVVEAQKSGGCEIVYHPMTMSKKTDHIGSVFIPLPTGKHFHCGLMGIAEPPLAKAIIERSIPCRTEYVELLTIENWFPTWHRFRVNIEIIKDEKLDVSTIIQGASFIDVLEKADYKLRFIAYKETVTNFKIIFLSEETGEYEFYELLFKTHKPGPAGHINLIAPLRGTTNYDITFENPLDIPILCNVTCPIREISVPTGVTILPRTKDQISVNFTPFQTGEILTTIEIQSEQLGVFTYDVTATCNKIIPEKPVLFTTNIGTAVSNSVFIRNPFPEEKLDFVAKIDEQQFQLDKNNISVLPGTNDIIIDVIFDPSTLGEINATLNVTSAVTGGFIVPLTGISQPPKTQGPINIKTGISHQFVVRNPFAFDVTIESYVDNRQFKILPFVGPLKSHKEGIVEVSFGGTNTRLTAAKLTVDAISEESGVSILQWIYYLQGVI